MWNRTLIIFTILSLCATFYDASSMICVPSRSIISYHVFLAVYKIKYSVKISIIFMQISLSLNCIIFLMYAEMFLHLSRSQNYEHLTQAFFTDYSITECLINDRCLNHKLRSLRRGNSFITYSVLNFFFYSSQKKIENFNKKMCTWRFRNGKSRYCSISNAHFLISCSSHETIMLIFIQTLKPFATL